MCLGPAGSNAATAPTSVPIGPPQPSVVSSLEIRPHTGAEAIDVSGQATAGSVVTVTLVSTFSVDLPDVVLSRSYIDADARGSYSATLSIAPGFTRGTFITVLATTTDGGPTLKARYFVDAPNHGVVVPLDLMPKEDQ
jgi:hypothetical protein